MTVEISAYPLAIEGQRVGLRDFTPDDLDSTMAIVGDPRVTAYLSFDKKDRQEQERLLAAQVDGAKASPRTEYYLAVTESKTGQVVGFARLGVGAHASAKLGYAIRWQDWGKGFATEAADTLLRFGFETVGLHRVTAACGPDNLASRRVLDKLGFTVEGRLRDHVFTNGAWRDSLLYSILAHEYPAIVGHLSCSTME